MKDWLIKLLGGFTRREYGALMDRYDAIPQVWTDAVKALQAEDRATFITGPAHLDRPTIDGALVIAPRSCAHVIGSFSERSYFPIDGEARIH